MGYYKYMKTAFQRRTRKQNQDRYIQWRSEPSFLRVERSTRIDRARSLGYKAKGGLVIVRACIKKGGRKRKRPNKGRMPSKLGVYFTPGKSKKLIAEERVQRKYPNMEVLNSYWVGEDGKHRWFEVILVDPMHPQIRSDKNLNWICEKQHTHRANRGLTTAGKKIRGLQKKGN
jgi:large subunit ribosomal protein L15e